MLVFNQIGEMRLLANSRKDEIRALKGNVERLKIAIAGGTGYKELLACFGETIGSNGVDPFLVLRDRFKESEDALKAAKSTIEGMSSEEREKAEVYDFSNSMKILQAESSLKEKVKDLEFKLAASSSDQIEALELKVETGDKTQAHLFTEMEAMCAAIEKLEEQVSGKVLSLIDKETQIGRLTIEKGKLDQKASALSKQLTTIANAQSSGKKLLDRQLERLRSYEESERALQGQIQILEKTVIVENAGILAYTTKLEASYLETEQVKGVLERTRLQLTKSEMNLTERSSMLTREVEEKREVAEECAVLKKRIGGLSQGGGDGDADLLRQITDLKVCEPTNTTESIEMQGLYDKV
jgi:hypothetical protein